MSGSLTPKPRSLTAKPRVATTDDVRGIAQRVLFPENVDIDPGLTVAMNDDSLYGWIEPGQSKPFPSGMTFTYSSDRPDVVSVNGQHDPHGRQRRRDDHGDRDVQRQERST